MYCEHRRRRPSTSRCRRYGGCRACEVVPAAVRGPVGADQGGRVGGDGADVGFRHGSHRRDPGGTLVGDDDVADRVERIAAPLARDLLDGSARLGRAMGRDGDADVGRQFDLAEVVEADLGDLLADARADIRIGEAFQSRRNAAFMQPGRQQEAQRVGGPVIGILVAVHVDAPAAGGVDDAEKAIGLAPAVGPGQLHVGDLLAPRRRTSCLEFTTADAST